MQIAPLGPQELDPAVLGTFDDSPVVMGQGTVCAHGRALVFKSFKGNDKRAAPTSELRFGGTGSVSKTAKESNDKSDPTPLETATANAKNEELAATYTKEISSHKSQHKGKPAVGLTRTQFQLLKEKPEIPLTWVSRATN